jgi:DNA adenine methylase
MPPGSISREAARFIYLNRTCWNGLYRVNRCGRFNTPRGTRDSVLFEDDDFELVATALRNVELMVADFEEVIDAAGVADFVFVDPPYTVKHNCNGFQRYNETIFRWSDQERLARCVERARNRGARLLVTNAAHDSVRELFKNIGEEVLLPRRSLVAADAAKRSMIEEVAIVVGYGVGEN